MRKLITLLLAAAMSVAGVAGIAAQDSGDTAGSGVGSTAIYFDDRGNQIATLEVTEVEAGWSDYADNGAPSRGYDFHAVHFTVTNDSDAPLEINTSRFSLVDTQGLNNSRAYVRVAEGSESNVLEDTVNLEAGETLEAALVFELFSDVSPAAFIWQPGSGTLVMAYVGDGSAEENAVVTGLNVPATFADDRGNPLGSIEVTEVEDSWDDYQENRGPDRGVRYVAVHFTVTNLSDAPIEVNPFNLSLLDSESANNGRAFTAASETAEVQVTDDSVDVAPGESFDGMLVYTLFDGVDPLALIWQPEFGVITVVILDDAGVETETEATPEEESDVDLNDLIATPAT